MPTINELIEKRATLATQAKKLIPSENRAMTGEENAQFDAIHKDIDALAGQIERLEKQDAIDKKLSESRNSSIGREDRIATMAGEGDEKRSRQLWNNYLRTGQVADEMRAGYLVGTNNVGGYAAPAYAAENFEILLRDYIDVRRAPVTVITTNGGNAFPYPTVDNTATAGGTTAEATALGTDSSTPFGNITFTSYNYDSTVVLVSWQLMQDSIIPIDQYLNNELAERIGVKENGFFTTGTGSSQPQGIVTGAGSSGVTLDTAGLGSTTAVAVDNLLGLIHSVAPIYRQRPGVGFMTTDSTVLAIRKLKDSQNRPLWEPSMQVGQPDRLWGYPIYLNTSMAAMATGVKSILFGDFSKFVIRQVQGVSVVVLHERYAEYRQNGYFGFHRADSHVVNSAAIKYAVNA